MSEQERALLLQKIQVQLHLLPLETLQGLTRFVESLDNAVAGKR